MFLFQFWSLKLCPVIYNEVNYHLIICQNILTRLQKGTLSKLVIIFRWKQSILSLPTPVVNPHYQPMLH